MYILEIIFKTFICFLALMGLLTFFLPIKLSLHLIKNGLLLGINHVYSEPKEQIKYIFFQIHLILFSIGIYIQFSSQE
jgi:ABC-type uncharacterized transport system permease subunit